MRAIGRLFLFLFGAAAMCNLCGQSAVDPSIGLSRDPALRANLAITMLECLKKRKSIELKESQGQYIAIIAIDDGENGKLWVQGDILHSPYLAKKAILIRLKKTEITSIDRGELSIVFDDAFNNAVFMKIDKKEFDWFINRVASIPLVRPPDQKNDWSLLDAYPDCVVFADDDSYVVRQSSGHDFWGAQLFHDLRERLSKLNK